MTTEHVKRWGGREREPRGMEGKKMGEWSVHKCFLIEFNKPKTICRTLKTVSLTLVATLRSKEGDRTALISVI